jgi:tetratricopeptide (TPR) repeat protein
MIEVVAGSLDRAGRLGSGGLTRFDVPGVAADMSHGRRARLKTWAIATILILLAAAFTGGYVVREATSRSDLADARLALAAGRIAAARERLNRLLQRSYHPAEVYLLLGECELARGRRDEALAAWAKVPADTREFSRASLLRGTHLLNSGRYAPAEDVLLAALAKPADLDRHEIERALGRLYRFEGRFEELRTHLRGSWASSPDPVGVLKELWALEHSPMPVESWGLALGKADGTDDRVWLGRANQAILTGRFESARKWLDQAIAKRPTDPAPWQSRLDLAVATDDLAAFWEAAVHVPARRFDDERMRGLRAWLAARAPGRKGERAELERLIEKFPTNIKALDRLAALAIEAGDTSGAAKLHARKSRLDRAQDEYRKILLDGAPLSPRAERLVELSTTLGRAFDASAWAIIADGRKNGLMIDDQSKLSGTSLARASALSGPYLSSPPDTPRLDDLLADLRQVSMPNVARQAPADTRNRGRWTPWFQDRAAASSLAFTFENGQTPEHQLPETMSGGVGLLDFDGDGWLDVYCIQGGPIPNGASQPETEQPEPSDRLFRNRRDGTFVDVTKTAGIAAIAWGKGYGMGVAVGDYDNDGDADLFLTRLTSYALYRNRGDGTFEDATAVSGLAGPRENPTSAAFADLDNDGDLDLYVCHYMRWDPAHPTLCTNDKGGYFYCDPSRVAAASDHLFRNDGGRFVDVTKAAGCLETDGRGLGVVAVDLDDDNRIDLYVANDGTANYFWHNRGNFQFEEIALEAGVAGSAVGGYQAGMGVGCGDYDGDGRPDLIVTNFYGEGATLYQNLGEGLFTDKSSASGVGLATKYLLGFGIAMADVNNDGRLDLLVANGHVNDNRPFYPYAMPARLHENQGRGKFVDISDRSGPAWEPPRVGRALAAGDVDNDGRLDAIVVSQNEPVAYFHNESKDVGRFIAFRLRGTKSNRDGIGARVTVVAGDMRQVGWRFGGGSYQSAADLRLHFGLGDHDRIDTVEVRWPTGQTDRWAGLAAGKTYELREGSKDAFAAQPGGSHAN